MRLAWRELLRRPRSFLVPLAILLLLSLLLLYPSAVLDAVVEQTSAALRHAPADLVVYSQEANGVILRSRVDTATRERIASTPGADEVATLDVALFTGQVEGEDEPVPFALLASDRPIGAAVPGPGEALADSSLRDSAGVREGSRLVVGPFRVPVTVTGFTTGTNLWFGGGLVVDKSTWLAALGAAADPSDPSSGGATGGGSASQALLVQVDEGVDPDAIAAAIDQATNGATETFTREAAVHALPGMEQQESTFGYIRAATVTVAVVVVGLFLSFVTLERAPLYAVLKAVGASSRQLFVGLIIQVLTITDLAVLTAAAITWGLTRLPVELPAELRWDRVVETTVALRTAAVVGSVLSLRRVARVDPADAIG
jgi:putative ABC transport system permease protein